MAQARFLCWVDLEATGQDEYLDPILEVGLVITELCFPFKELASYEAVSYPEEAGWIERMNGVVADMHESNGLVDDVQARGRPLEAIENEILALLMAHGRPHEFIIAGSGVGHYDRRFIKAQMPKFDKWLQHPALDVGSVRRLLRFSKRSDLEAFGLTFEGEDKPHRGLADVRDHLNELREYASLIQSIPKEES